MAEFSVRTSQPLKILTFCDCFLKKYFSLKHGFAASRWTENNNGIVNLTLFQTHPNIDKKLFTASSMLGLKNSDKPFPMGQEVGVLKWRFQTTDESYMPLSSKFVTVKA